jgi:Putative auto-transporter adhesin, head GIN domain
MRILCLCTLLLFACKKAEDRSCLKFTGKDSTRSVQLEDFTKLEVGPYLDYVLIQDSVDFVKIQGGENVINLVDVHLQDETVHISNKNACRFLRSQKKKIQIEIHFTNLNELLFEGSGSMTNEGILQLPNFSLSLKEGSGTVNLSLESDFLVVSAEPSWSNYILSGHAVIANLTVKGNSYGDARNLTVDSTFTIVSRSSAPLRVNAENSSLLQGEAWSTGNVYYSGNPNAISWNSYGTGKLLLDD